ncbi:hypothetical protein N177_3120 [Lutibaculum baratangense AMV1]|uniref:Uncharacterized protein n=1 Tax=Lutibaculum baratangense AMV1 TaxID=631454 RepID=V4QTH1_9HYPH|nr:hypothetical protein N177_3120 [Lutibaculum baratangense AMV1]
MHPRRVGAGDVGVSDPGCGFSGREEVLPEVPGTWLTLGPPVWRGLRSR